MEVAKATKEVKNENEDVVMKIEEKVPLQPKVEVAEKVVEKGKASVEYEVSVSKPIGVETSKVADGAEAPTVPPGRSSRAAKITAA